MTPVIILVSGIFAVAAVIGVIDLFVHAVCAGARSLRSPHDLEAQEPRPAPPPQSITA